MLELVHRTVVVMLELCDMRQSLAILDDLLLMAAWAVAAIKPLDALNELLFNFTGKALSNTLRSFIDPLEHRQHLNQNRLVLLLNLEHLMPHGFVLAMQDTDIVFDIHNPHLRMLAMGNPLAGHDRLDLPANPDGKVWRAPLAKVDRNAAMNPRPAAKIAAKLGRFDQVRFPT